MFLSLRRYIKKKGAAEPRSRLVLAERDLGAARHVPLASPLVQEEGRRRIWAPPSRGLGLGLQSPTWGRLAMFLSLLRWFKKKGVVGLVRPPPSQALGWGLQSATWWRLAMSLSLRRSFKRTGAVDLGRRRADGSAGACRARLGGG